VSKCDEWQRRLKFRLARASGFERPGIIREAFKDARQLVGDGDASRKDVLDIIEAAAREYNIRSIAAKPQGMFAGPPFHDGPAAA
jgi:hypothetical protein